MFAVWIACNKGNIKLSPWFQFPFPVRKVALIKYYDFTNIVIISKLSRIYNTLQHRQASISLYDNMSTPNNLCVNFFLNSHRSIR
jgi:hypothetical protein